MLIQEGETRTMEVHGHCDERFLPVQEAFERNFEENGDVGACFAATLEGEYVVDLWAGYHDEARTRPWLEDTIVTCTPPPRPCPFYVR